MTIDMEHVRAVCEAAGSDGKDGANHGSVVWIPEDKDDRLTGLAAAQAKFIALARTALPEALDEIDRLRALLVEACDIAKKKRTWRFQTGPSNWERVDIGPDENDSARVSQIRALAEGEGRK